MAKKDVKAFIKTGRHKTRYRPVCERIKDYREVAIPRVEEKSQEQATRCMDCGTPFCHWACSIGNYIPEWNDAVISGDWEKAATLLCATNNLPEITGRVCPALCEYACVLGINDDPVTIRENELNIIEYAFSHGLIKAHAPQVRTGKKVAVIGSGPAGLAAAGQLNQAGHTVTLFEKDKNPGGILRYGIPDFKLDKAVIDRRIDLMRDEGIITECGVNVGVDYPAGSLLADFDAVCLAIGSRVPRDLTIPGRHLKGIHFAMDYLTLSNRKVAGETIPQDEDIDANGKKVVVIGGGDTGADCVGTAHRQGAACVVQIELLPKPAECRTGDYPWPTYPMVLKTSTSHEEGGERKWAVLTKKFSGKDAQVRQLTCVEVEFSRSGATDGNCPVMKEISGSQFDIETDLVIIAIGFLHPEHKGLLADLGITTDKRGNIKTDASYRTTTEKVFSAGDCRRGQSLVVWAIEEGRRAAYNIDTFLMGISRLPKL